MKEQITKEKLESIVKDSLSKAEVLRKLGNNIGASQYKLLDNNIRKFNIDITHFTGAAWNTGSRYRPIENVNKYSDEEVFIKNSKLASTSSLRKRILKDKLLNYKCALCNLDTIWNNKEIVLHIDHINGVNSDNRLENLRFLCPNCHSQTDTYCGRSSSRKKESTLSERREVKYRKFREAVLQIETHGNPEPSFLADNEIIDISAKIEGAETLHGKPKVSRIKPRPTCLICGEECHTLKAKYCSYKCAKEASSSLIPKKQEILDAFKEYKNFLQVGIYFNVSDNAVRKWCLKYGILAMVKRKSEE